MGTAPFFNDTGIFCRGECSMSWCFPVCHLVIMDMYSRRDSTGTSVWVCPTWGRCVLCARSLGHSLSMVSTSPPQTECSDTQQCSPMLLHPHSCAGWRDCGLWMLGLERQLLLCHCEEALGMPSNRACHSTPLSSAWNVLPLPHPPSSGPGHQVSEFPLPLLGKLTGFSPLPFK